MPKDEDGNDIVTDDTDNDGDTSGDTDNDGDTGDTDTDTDADTDADNDGDTDDDDADLNANALAEAMIAIDGLSAQVADLTAETVRLKAVNSTLLAQIPADEETDIEDDDLAGDDEDNYDSVDDALEANRID